MKSKTEFKEIDIKNRVYYYFDDIINDTKISFSGILLDKNHMKIFQFVTFCIKLQHVQNQCVLGSIK